MTEADRRWAREAFEHWARSGYAPDLLAEAEERLADLLADPPPPALLAEVRALAQRVLDEQRAAEATWTEPTTNDRITEAFDDLEDRGVVALEDAGYTDAEGWEDAREAARDFPEPRGAVLFHGHDVEGAVRGEGLSLTFGALGRGGRKGEAAVAIGREVVEVLAAHGVATTWDGTAGQRIRIPPFPWRKRQFTEPPL